MRRVMVGLLCVVFLSGGCTKQIKATAARYKVGDEPVVAYAKHAGIWRIKATPDQDDKLKTLPATERLVEKGEAIGFYTDDATGRVVAFIGDDDVFLPDGPALQQYAWSYNHKRRTQFGKEMSKARQSARDVAKFTAAVGLIGSLIVLDAALLDAASRDECHR